MPPHASVSSTGTKEPTEQELGYINSVAAHYTDFPNDHQRIFEYMLSRLEHGWKPPTDPAASVPFVPDDFESILLARHFARDDARKKNYTRVYGETGSPVVHDGASKYSELMAAENSRRWVDLNKHQEPWINCYEPGSTLDALARIAAMRGPATAAVEETAMPERKTFDSCEVHYRVLSHLFSQARNGRTPCDHYFHETFEAGSARRRLAKENVASEAPSHSTSPVSPASEWPSDAFEPSTRKTNVEKTLENINILNRVWDSWKRANIRPVSESLSAAGTISGVGHVSPPVVEAEAQTLDPAAEAYIASFKDFKLAEVRSAFPPRVYHAKDLAGAVLDREKGTSGG